jgi:hypothetical protein
VQGDRALMSQHFEASIGPKRTNAAFGWQAHVLAFAGRVDAAHEQFRRGIQAALQGGFKEVAGSLAIEDAETHAIVGQCSQATPEVAEGLALTRDNFAIERASRALALCGAGDQATALADDLTRRLPEAVLTSHVSVPVTQAILALRRGDAARALQVLGPVEPYDHTPWSEFWSKYLRGQAQLQLKNGTAAASQFQRIISHRGEAPVSSLYPLAYLGLARASLLSHNTAGARAAYDAFFERWPEPDANLPLVQEARQEQARLRN